MLGQVLVLIVGTVVGFFATVCLIRFFMQACRVSFSHQLGAFVLQLTNWLVKPLRRVIPGLWGQDLASLVAAYLALLISTTVTISVGSASMLSLLPAGSIVGIILWGAVVGLLRLVVYLFIGALILQAVLSWVNPHSPILRPLHQLTGPLLNPVRRVLPPIAGVDLSPLVVILFAQVVLVLL